MNFKMSSFEMLETTTFPKNLCSTCGELKEMPILQTECLDCYLEKERGVS